MRPNAQVYALHFCEQDAILFNHNAIVTFSSLRLLWLV